MRPLPYVLAVLFAFGAGALSTRAAAATPARAAATTPARTAVVAPAWRPEQAATKKDALKLSAASADALEAVLARAPLGAEAWRELLRAVLVAEGDAQALEKELERLATEPAGGERALVARTGLAWVLYHDGRLQAALDQTELVITARTPKDPKGPPDVAPEFLLHRAHLCDALGKLDAAIEAYAAARAATNDGETLQHIDLAVALIEADRDAGATKTAGASGGARAVAAVAGGATSVAVVSLVSARASSGGAPSSSLSGSVSAGSEPAAAEPKDASALYRLASAEGAEHEFKNRASIVLALLGRPAEAIRLYASAGEKSDLFKQEIRLAEWSLTAGEPSAAQEHAWKARAAAALKRDRAYALTVLVEAHRADKSLARLLERFAAETVLDEESRAVWIDILRETARVDEAMALFKSAHQGAFTPEMRRELLDMCREAGREDELVTTYRQLIAEEPERLEWREGLARSFLERGRREDAQAIWQAYVDTHTATPEYLQAARAARAQGLDAFARATAERCLAGAAPAAGSVEEAGRLEARLFLSELEQSRGRTDAALAELARFDAEAGAASPERVRLAEAFERLGDKQRAVDVLEALRAARGADASEEDLEMRLAWLCSEVGREELALERWMSLWKRVTSIPRRRQVEDRLMAVAARLGKLSDIAVDLESKLANGAADDREAGLLVRLYTKVGDPVSAAEVVEEHLKSRGKSDADVLAEKARIYLGGKDYYRYEKAIRKLIAIDPENKPDHLRQLAMSNLERGKPVEARAVLAELARTESPGDAAEFEAGVLALAGLNEDAARTYRKGLAANPDRIDGWLLLGNALKSLNRTDQATGLFQMLASSAEKDDLFTVAIDGVLNMRAKEPVLRWARRATLERIARRHDKLYLYQLCTDLCEELEDQPGLLRALESSLAIAGEQRTSILRQLMDSARGKQSNSFMIVNGVMQQRHEGGMDKQRLAYGRRLIGLGDVVPPGVYLELGETFLQAGEVSNASKTFSMARDVPDWSAFQRQVATSFENAQYVENALGVYERLMASQAPDASLLLKTGELNEMLGRDARAADLYAKALVNLLAQEPLSATDAGAKKPDDDEDRWAPKNLGEFERWFGALESGLYGAAETTTLRAFFEAQQAELERDLAAWDALPRAAGAKPRPAEAPRLVKRAALVRRIGLRAGWIDAMEPSDLALARRFPADADLCETLARERLEFGATGAAERIVARSGLDASQRASVLGRLGRGDAAQAGQRALSPGDLVARLVPLLLEGDRAKLGLALRAAQLGAPRKEDLAFVQVLVSAAVFAGDAPSVDALTGYALRTIVAHGSGWEDTQKVLPLLERARGVLAPDAYDVLIDSFVQLVAADEKKLQQFQYVLSQLSESRGRPLLSADAVQKRLTECLPDRYYMLDSLLGLVPADARLGLLNPLWSKVPAAQRAYMALNLMSNENETLPAPLSTFLADAFATGLESVDEPAMLSYPMQQIVGSSRLPPELVRKLVAEASKRWADDPAFQALEATAIAKQGDAAGGLARVQALLPALAKADDEREWVLQNALNTLVATLGKAHAEEFLALIEAYEAAAPSSDGPGADRIYELRSTVLELLGDRARLRALLEARLEKQPKDARALRELADEAAKSGDLARQRELLERLVAVDKKPATRTQLVNFWRARSHPLHALAVRDAGVKKDGAAPASEDQKKLEAASLVTVKRALDAGRVDDARALYRRTWREFHQESPYGRVFRSRGFGQRDPVWPEDGATDDDAGPDRTGLAGFALEEPPKKDERKRTAYDVLAELPFGGDELARQARSLDAAALQSSRALLRGLMHAETKRLGERAAVDAWTRSVRDGSASTTERALLLAWFEEHAAELGSEHQATLAGLASAVHPLDSAQLRALARLHVKLGLSARAATIYRWCGALSSGRRWFYGNDATISARELLDEVAEELTGDERGPVVESILAAARPGAGPGSEDENEEFDALVLATWRKVLGPARALEHCRDVVERAIDPRRGLARAPALEAAHLLSAGNDSARALRGLELGLCRFEPTEVVLAQRQTSRATWLLQPRWIAWNDVRTLFPAGASPDWCERAARAALGWEQKGRLQDGIAAQFLIAAVQRLHALGNEARAAALFDELARLPSSSSIRLAVADLARLLKRDGDALVIEDELLARQALPASRVLERVERVRAAEGVPKALALAESASDWTLSPGLCARLVALAGEANDAERRARWESASTAAAAAAKELKLPW